MKILTTKKYNQLLQELTDKDNKITKLIGDKAVLEEMLEEKKTSCKANTGKGFCNACKNSYSYKTSNGLCSFNNAGCTLNVTCEKFEKKGV